MLLKYRIINLHLFIIRRNYLPMTHIMSSTAKEWLKFKGGICVNEIIFRCPKNCPWNKHCFVCKIQGEVYGDGVILHKCEVTKEDIPIRIMERQETA